MSCITPINRLPVEAKLFNLLQLSETPQELGTHKNSEKRKKNKSYENNLVQWISSFIK